MSKKGPGRAYLEDVLRRIRTERPRSREDMLRIKREAARAHAVDAIPPNSLVLNALDADERERYLPLLVKKPTRSLSGVAIVTVQAPPEPCPHGTCTFCPGGPRFGTAQSYTGHEPAARRAARHAFDPFGQARSRLAELEHNGHPVDKVDLIVQGGTFPARDAADQRAFVLALFDALNSHGGAPRHSNTLQEAQQRNEAARSRCVGLTIETKPDWCLEPHVDLMLELGATRVEVGVQTTFDRVLAATHRGHTMDDTYRATQLARDAGLKVCYHLMPGLPGATRAMDLESARHVFEDPRLRPDMLKVYPTLVVPGTALERQWRAGRYTPLDDEEAADLVARVLAMVPPWMRVQRVDRDIPTHQIAAGVMHTNLRQRAEASMGSPCRCLRCREAPRKTDAALELTDVTRTYDASGGREVFLSIEDATRDAVVGYCRLRLPSTRAHRSEVSGRAIVRELKVVGSEVPIDEAPGSRRAHQHRGHGRRLMERAQHVAREAGYEELLVLAGVGTRPYYAKIGYEKIGPYVVRLLES